MGSILIIHLQRQGKSTHRDLNFLVNSDIQNRTTDQLRSILIVQTFLRSRASKMEEAVTLAVPQHSHLYNPVLLAWRLEGKA